MINFNPKMGPVVFQSISVGSYANIMQKEVKDRLLAPDIDVLWWNNDLSKYKPYSDYWNTVLLTGGHYCNIPNARQKLNWDVDKTIVFADSGGFQLRTGKGIIQNVMYDDNGAMTLYAPSSNNKKILANSGYIKYSNNSLKKILEWQENNSDIFINLDVPPFGTYSGKFEYALEASSRHFKYYADNRTKPNTILLNVLHGTDLQTISTWYNEVKQYSFDGWAIGIVAMGMYATMIKLAILLQHGEFAKKSCKVIHFLGTTALYYILIMSRLQYHLNNYTNDNIQITCDSSTAGQRAVYGQLMGGIHYKQLSYKLIDISQNISDKDLYEFNKSFVLPYCDYEVSVDKIIPKYKLGLDITYNNVLCIFDSASKIYEYAKYPLDMLRQCNLFDNIYILLLESIDKMIDNPHHAINIAQQYRHVYDNIDAQSVTNKPDNNILNEFFN